MVSSLFAPKNQILPVQSDSYAILAIFDTPGKKIMH